MGVTTPYIKYICRFGIPRIIMPEEEIVENLDLLMLPGGSDIDPLRYKAIPGYDTTKPDPMKEYFDTIMLPQYIENNTPIFGICRGMQSICVHFGATLVQHMHHETSVERDEGVHEIELRGDIPIKAKIKVNSLHHQCVSSNNFPTHLEVIGIYKGKLSRACIEVVRHRTLPIYGVQYHPEEMINDSLSNHIIDLLLSNNELEEVILDHGELRKI
jgi:putative glutamine amidotransferase